MKKPMLATAGVAGACAVCCAIPIFIPLASGLSVAGLLAYDWEQLWCSQEFIAAATGTIVAISVAFMLWRARRDRTSGPCAVPQNPNDATPKSSCGCKGTATKTPGEASL